MTQTECHGKTSRNRRDSLRTINEIDNAWAQVVVKSNVRPCIHARYRTFPLITSHRLLLLAIMRLQAVRRNVFDERHVPGTENACAEITIDTAAIDKSTTRLNRRRSRENAARSRIYRLGQKRRERTRRACQTRRFNEKCGSTAEIKRTTLKCAIRIKVHERRKFHWISQVPGET